LTVKENCVPATAGFGLVLRLETDGAAELTESTSVPELYVLVPFSTATV
jgi:hypothetical protein